MALRSHVSRIAARGTVTIPAIENSVDDTEQTETSSEETVEQEIPVRSNRYAGASRAPVQEEPPVPEPESAGSTANETAAATQAPARRGRPPVDRTKAKKSLQTTPTLVGTESISELRAKVKEVEQLIKDARTRHDEEMKTLKTVYSDLHVRMFDHVK